MKLSINKKLIFWDGMVGNLKPIPNKEKGGSDVDDTVQSGQQASWLIRDTWVA